MRRRSLAERGIHLVRDIFPFRARLRYIGAAYRRRTRQSSRLRDKVGSSVDFGNALRDKGTLYATVRDKIRDEVVRTRPTRHLRDKVRDRPRPRKIFVA